MGSLTGLLSRGGYQPQQEYRVDVRRTVVDGTLGCFQCMQDVREQVNGALAVGANPFPRLRWQRGQQLLAGSMAVCGRIHQSVDGSAQLVARLR